MNIDQISDYAYAKEVAKWDKITTRLQYTSIGGVFLMIIILENIPKHTAHWLVWYLAGFLMVLTTAAFLCGQKFLKLQHEQWDRSTQRIKDMYDRLEQESKTKIRK